VINPESSVRMDSKKKDDLLIKRRSTIACDRCRRTKYKCERVSDDGPCESCAVQHLDCHFSPPSTKRGPAKGYLHALEARCHAVEAILGILLSIPDERAVNLLTELAEDSFAKDVLEQVNNSRFGLRGRLTGEESQASTSSESASLGDVVDPFKDGPTNQWQDALITKHIKQRKQAVQPYGLLSSSDTASSSLTQNKTDTT